MFQIKAQVNTFEFDAVGYTAAMKKYLDKQARLGAREFAREALKRIPIRTGFVAGSFGTLTDLIGSGARFNPIVTFTRKVISAAKNAFGVRKKPEVGANGRIEYYYGGGGKTLKSPTSGRSFATPASDIFKWQGDVLVFTFEVDISYLAVNDNFSGHSPTAPWSAFLAGRAAFEDYMQKVGLLALPKFEDYLVPTDINIG
jgi:hypothetical protein